MEVTRRVLSSECGIDGKFELEDSLLILQDAYTVALGEMGYSNFDLNDHYDAMWVISKQRVRVYLRPEWNHQITIRSKIIKAGRLALYLETTVYEDDKLLIEGLTEACALSKKDFKFIRLNTFENLKVEEKELDFTFNVDDEGDFTKVKTFKASPLICDMSHHLNNAKALYPLIDNLSPEDIAQIVNRPYEVTIKYLAQGPMESNLSLEQKKNSDSVSYRYINDENKTIDVLTIKNI